MKITRREALAGLSVSTAAILAKEAAAASSPITQDPVAQDPLAQGGLEGAPAYRGNRPLVPLPFKTDQLRGISEKLIVSHHENNYAGALRNLNKVETALAQVSKETPPYVVAGLKERQLNFANSVTLHELYFGNLGGDGKPAGAIVTAATETYGRAGRWEEEMRAAAACLAGGSGWVVLDLDLFSGSLRVHGCGNHTQSRAATVPLLVLDMYEHAYQMDHGAAAAKYVDAFFANVRWDEVERRFARATAAAAALRA